MDHGVTDQNVTIPAQCLDTQDSPSEYELLK